MRRRYTPNQALRVRSPLPQVSVGDLPLGEPAVVQEEEGPYYAEAPQAVLPLAHGSIVGAFTTTTPAEASFPPVSPLTLASITSAVNTPAASVDAANRAVLSAARAVSSIAAAIASGDVSATSARVSTSSADAFATTSDTTSSLASSSASASSLVPPMSSSIGSSSLVSTSAASSSVSSSINSATPSDSSSSPSASTSAIVSPSSNMSHRLPIYAGVALGLILLITLLAIVIRCIIRTRTRRKEAVSAIAWDPVVLEDGKGDRSDGTFAGDRDLGEPKRAESFVDRHSSFHRQSGDPFDAAYQQHSNPFSDAASYGPHPQLADSIVYPLPPLPLATSNSGPYPTSRPLPPHLADRDPHRISQSGSIASSRSGSVRSTLCSASTLGPLCVTNGPLADSRASTALGMNGRAPQHGELDFGESVQNALECGTPREREARPRFVGLRGSTGLDVPWRRESFAERGRGQPGWTPLPTPGGATPAQEEGEREGWTQTIRAGVMGAWSAVAGATILGGTPPNEPGRDMDDDGLTHAPSMNRQRRESGWRRFTEQMDREGDVGSLVSTSSVGGTIYVPESGSGHLYLAPPASLQFTNTTTASISSDTVTSNNSRTRLIGQPPRPVTLLSRESSIYSTVSMGPYRNEYDGTLEDVEEDYRAQSRLGTQR
ncbi:hypothetical protein C8J57DRAFT_1516695 [Mycena rebaudengoi]|nr:hypothetical protein C8J57DRAFT_1516695 [Mycena rebaudengoi]